MAISTYSSGSCRETTPSKKTQRTTTLAPEVGAGVAVGVASPPPSPPDGVEPAGGLHPASIASSSVQKKRSPAASSMTVRE